MIEIKLKFGKWRWPALFVTVILALSAYWFTQEWLGSRVDGYAVVKEELIQAIVAGGTVELPSGV